MKSTKLFSIACLVALVCLTTGTESELRQVAYRRKAAQEHQFRKDRAFMLEAYKEKLERLIESAEDMKSEAPSSHKLIKAYQEKIESLEIGSDSSNAHDSDSDEQTSDPDNHYLNHISRLKAENEALRKNQEIHIWLSQDNTNQDQGEKGTRHQSYQKPVPKLSPESPNVAPAQPQRPNNVRQDEKPLPKIYQVPVGQAKIQKSRGVYRSRDPDKREPLLGRNGKSEHTDHILEEIEKIIATPDLQDEQYPDREPQLLGQNHLDEASGGALIVEKKKLGSELTEAQQYQAVTEGETQRKMKKMFDEMKKEHKEMQAEHSLEGEMSESKERKDKMSTSDTITLTVAAVAIVCAIVFIVFTTIQWRKTMKIIKVDQMRSRQSLQVIRDEVKRMASGSSLASNSMDFDEADDIIALNERRIEKRSRKASSPTTPRGSTSPKSTAPRISVAVPAKPLRTKLSYKYRDHFRKESHKGHVSSPVEDPTEKDELLEKQCSVDSYSGESGTGRF